MNGRIYDPLLGRMLSADLVVQAPGNLQAYNRYSYVQNNPLTLVDPTGWYSILGLEFTDGGGVSGFFKDLGGYTADAGSGAGQGAWNATVGGAISAGNDAGQMYIDARDSGSSGIASFGYATSMGLGRMSGGMGLVEFYTGTKVETASNGSLKTGDFSSVTEWAVHGAASYAQAATTAVGIKTLSARVGEMAPKTAPAPEVPATAPTEVTKPVGELRAAGQKDAHHVIQDAAMRDVPGYDTQAARGVKLPGPSTAKGTPHYEATQVQREAGGGTYGAERRIGYKALRRAGIPQEDARQAVQEADTHFKKLGVERDTKTRMPGNRRKPNEP